jgi:UDP-glucose 4-epimerase
VSASAGRWLVTGGCGFVGVNLLRLLQARGAPVRVLDDLSMGRAEDVDGLGAEVVVGDIRDPGAVERALDGVDVVVHLAAHTRVIESIENPLVNFDVNARGTLALLEAVRRRGGLRRFVLASTGGAILGDVMPPVHEGMPARPLAPYGAGKLASEGYCSAYFGSYGIPTVALRFSNVYGPWSYQKGSVVAAFFKRILAGQPLVIYGDGEATRDFLWVGDLCAAIVAATERECGGDVFHIAAGRETSVGTLAELMLRVTGAAVEVRHEPARRGEVQRNTARIDHARAVLGWEPVQPLEQGLRETWAWFQAHARRL